MTSSALRPQSLRHALSVASLLALAGPAAAQPAAELPADASVVVTGSATQRRVDEVPYAISVVGRDQLREAGPQVNLSESLVRVPGVVANLRHNYAQDLQISTRGFGARAGFGVRGLRLYTDGIPATGPDGQGQVSHFDLAGAQRVEVLRGPFSALYGNSSGGVISLVTAPATQREAELGLDVGSHGLRQLRAGLAMPLPEGFDLKLSLAHLQSDGFRPQSEAERTLANVRLGWQGERDRVVLQLNHLDQPAQDPLGLNRADFDADPGQTTAVATQFDTRKVQRQTQGGLSWRHRFDDGALRESSVALYAGQRGVTQWQAIPVATQGNPRHGGGVVDFDRSFQGLEARLRWGWEALDVVAGVAADQQFDDRRGYENFTGAGADQVLGVTGKPRRDEANRALNRDAFVQADMAFNPDLRGSIGLRKGRTELRTRDAYLSNGDDSGERSFNHENPVAGLRWRAWHSADSSLQWHLAASRASESPTLGELAYRADGGGGFNPDLKPQTSRQLELGMHWRAPSLVLDATAFHVQTTREITTLTNAGGRSTFQNAGRTLRQGLELSGAWRPAAAWKTEWALTWLDASYQDSFLACAGIPCSKPTVIVPSGNRIAGTQRTSGWAALAWRDARLGEWAVEAKAVGRTAVNDTNSDFAAGYHLLGLRWQQQYALSAGQRLEVLARVDNLLDRSYAGSVIVNDGNGRYFETGAPRSALLSLRWVGGL